MFLAEVQNAISEKKICVLIPTYNNEKTLKRVIDGVLDYTESIIVVNDGSTDSTPQVLAQYPQITVISLPENKGKGNGLKTGFRAAKKSGYDYAITIDSDGQHYPDDIPVFVEALLQKKRKFFLSETEICLRMGFLRKVVSETVFPISGFGLKPVSGLKIHSPAIDFILCIKFQRNILPQSLNLK